MAKLPLKIDKNYPQNSVAMAFKNLRKYTDKTSVLNCENGVEIIFKISIQIIIKILSKWTPKTCVTKPKISREKKPQKLSEMCRNYL